MAISCNKPIMKRNRTNCDPFIDDFKAYKTIIVVLITIIWRTLTLTRLFQALSSDSWLF